MKPVQVLYHENCDDGFGAAYAAWTKFGENAIYVPVQYGKPAPEIIQGSDLYILDFSFDVETLEKMRLISDSILVLDHHESAMKRLADLPYAVFDMERSGAMMAWQHFHPGAPVPRLIEGVQDRDLYTFKIPTTEALSSGLRSVPRDFPTWDKLANDEQEIQSLIDRSQPLVDANHAYIDTMAKKVSIKDIVLVGKTFKLGIINSTHLISDLGNLICKQNPECFAALIFTITADGVLCSLRSIGEKNTTEISCLFGGGGHKNASGFKITDFETFFKTFMS